MRRQDLRKAKPVLPTRLTILMMAPTDLPIQETAGRAPKRIAKLLLRPPN